MFGLMIDVTEKERAGSPWLRQRGYICVINKANIVYYRHGQTAAI